MKQQTFISGGPGTWVGTILKLLPITDVNQIHKLDKGISYASFAHAEKRERLSTLWPYVTHFYVSAILFGKINFLHELRWTSSRQQQPWVCTQWLASLCRVLCSWKNGKHAENDLAFSFGNHHFPTSFISWAKQYHGTRLSCCRRST